MSNGAARTARCRTGTAIAQLAATLLVVMAACAIRADNWPAAGSLAAITLAALASADVSYATLLRRLALFLPTMSLVALSIPLSQGFTLAWFEVAATIVLRGSISFLAGLWLIQVLPVPRLLATLSLLRVPGVIVAMLAMMHRYLFVLWEESSRLRTARRARQLGAGGRLETWFSGVALIGTLLIRSLDRSHRIHQAMLSRGWDGTVRDWSPTTDDSR